jgi:hypothetical protein
LDAEELQAFKSTMDIRSYREQFLNEFVSRQGGKAYYNYVADKHVREIPFNSLYPICVSTDWNVPYQTPVFSQVLNNDFVNILEEFTDRDTNVYKITPMIQQRLIQYAGGNESVARSRRTIFYGDYAGYSRNVAARGTAWDELKQFFTGWNIDMRISPSPYIDRRVAAVNARLMTADGQVHMAISSKCKELLLDLESVSMDDLTKSKDKVGERTHTSDGISYGIWKEFPVNGGNKWMNA